jgi:hypothetical protein
MTNIEYLDDCIEKHYSRLFQNGCIVETDKVVTETFACKTLLCNSYILKISCDRLLIEAEIASKHLQYEFISIDGLYRYIKKNFTSDSLNKWDLKMINSKHLSSEEQVDFLILNNEVIKEQFSKERSGTTIKSIQAILSEK